MSNIPFKNPELWSAGFNLEMDRVTQRVASGVWVSRPVRGRYSINGQWYSHYQLRALAQSYPVDVVPREASAGLISRVLDRVSGILFPQALLEKLL